MNQEVGLGRCGIILGYCSMAWEDAEIVTSVADEFFLQMFWGHDHDQMMVTLIGVCLKFEQSSPG